MFEGKFFLGVDKSLFSRSMKCRDMSIEQIDKNR